MWLPMKWARGAVVSCQLAATNRPPVAASPADPATSGSQRPPPPCGLASSAACRSQPSNTTAAHISSRALSSPPAATIISRDTTLPAEPDNVQSKAQKTFYIGTFFKASWLLASKYCRHRGMRLASIDSEEDQLQLEAMLDEYGSIDLGKLWLSGTNFNEAPGVYIWNNGKTKSPMSYTKWLPKEPTHTCSDGMGSTVCCSILKFEKKYGYGWANEACIVDYYFVCELTDASSKHC